MASELAAPGLTTSGGQEIGSVMRNANIVRGLHPIIQNGGVLPTSSDCSKTTVCITEAQVAPNLKRAQLIGRRWEVKCYILHLLCKALGDTGAQVSLMDEDFLRNTLHTDVETRPFSELVDQDLVLEGVVNGEIKY